MHYGLNYFSASAKFERARARYLARHRSLPAVISTLLTSPLPAAECPLMQLPVLSIDFETTGLDPRQDHILSIGTIEIKAAGIELSSAQHNYVNGPHVVKAETAVINQLMPALLASGQPLDELMENLFITMAGHILLAHGSMVEQRFIDAYLQNRFNLPPLPLPWLDTLVIAQRRVRHQRELATDFRLSSLRQQSGLPDYPAHDALIDAIATAELLLADSHRLITTRPITLRELLRLQGKHFSY